MLQAHSFLWHYLWVAPNILLLGVAFGMWRRGLHLRYPAFWAFAVIGASDQLVVYAADLLPWVSPETWWRIFWGGLLLEGLLKFALVGEIFAHVFNVYASVAKLGRLLIRGVGIALIFAAAIAAAYAPKDSPYGLISGAHLLEQTIYLIEAGLLVFIFVFSGYFRLTIQRTTFGIALGLGISACVHLGTWAILANSGLPASKRIIFDFVNMATYHACALIWSYYLLVPHEADAGHSRKPPSGPSGIHLTDSANESNLDVWNRELERLLQ